MTNDELAMLNLRIEEMRAILPSTIAGREWFGHYLDAVALVAHTSALMSEMSDRVATNDEHPNDIDAFVTEIDAAVRAAMASAEGAVIRVSCV